MKQYVKFISDTEISYPVESDFQGVVNPLLHDGLMRRNGFFPLVGKPDEIEGKTLVLDRFLLRKASKTRTASFQKVVEDFDDDPNNPGHVIKTGEHTEWAMRDVTVDDSTVMVESYHYEDVPTDVSPVRTVCTKYQLVCVLRERHSELLDRLRSAYAESCDLQFFWNTVQDLDRTNDDFRSAQESIGITDDEVSEIFSEVDELNL